VSKNNTGSLPLRGILPVIKNSSRHQDVSIVKLTHHILTNTGSLLRHTSFTHLHTSSAIFGQLDIYVPSQTRYSVTPHTRTGESI